MAGFDVDDLVDRCRSAIADADPVGAVADVLRSVVGLGAAIEEALGPTNALEPDTLHESPDLTVQRIAWPGGVGTAPHEHRMWAVVGVYAGREVNRLYERPLRPKTGRVVEVEAGSVLTLDVDAVHDVQNPRREWTAGLHVYGGAIAHVDRSAWLPDGTEAPQAFVSEQRRAMVQAMRDVAADSGRTISAEDRYLALMALWREVDLRGRNLSVDEAREVVLAAW